MKDLFECPTELPENIQEILNRYSDADTYIELEKMYKEMIENGYTFEYYLDAVPYNLQKIKL